MARRVVKKCACGAAYTQAEWNALSDVKIYRVGEDKAFEVHEQRRCEFCMSHIVRIVSRDRLKDGEHIGTVVERGVPPYRVDIEHGQVVLAHRGKVDGLTPMMARDLASLLLRGAALAEDK